MAAQPARHPTPNRWRGPLGTSRNPVDVEEEEAYFDEMCDRIVGVVFTVGDALPSAPLSLIEKFCVAEEKIRADFAGKNSWLATIPPLRVPKNPLKELRAELFLTAAEAEIDADEFDFDSGDEECPPGSGGETGL